MESSLGSLGRQLTCGVSVPQGRAAPAPPGPCLPVRSPSCLDGCLSALLSCPVRLPGVWAGTRAAPYPWRPPAGGEALGLPVHRQTWIQTSGLSHPLRVLGETPSAGPTPGRDLSPCQGLRSVLPSGLNRGGRDSGFSWGAAWEVWEFSVTSPPSLGAQLEPRALPGLYLGRTPPEPSQGNQLCTAWVPACGIALKPLETCHEFHVTDEEPEAQKRGTCLQVQGQSSSCSSSVSGNNGGSWLSG